MSELTFEYPGSRNRVLRNTYWLLALSMVPTMLGAWLGLGLGLVQVVAASPLSSLVLMVVVAFIFIFAIEMTKESGLGIAILMLFTLFMGAVLSPLISVILAKSNGVQLITLAAGGTGVIFALMAFLSSTIKRDISGWGKFLTVGLVLLIFGIVANMFLQITALALTISILAIGIFSAFLLFDLKRIVDGGETNYISATLAIYLDLFNIFQHLLSIFGLTSSND